MLFKHATIAAFILVLAPSSVAGAQTGSIRGKVREQKGKSLSDVLIKATNAEKKDESFEARSGENGEFTLSGLPGGNYILTFEKQGFKTFTTRRLTIAAGDTLKLRSTIEIVREGEAYSLIRGAVLFDLGYSLPNALVLIERIDVGKKFKQETVSREGGEFAFRLRAEKAVYRITASAKGFLPKSVEIEVDYDEVRNIAITLEKEK
ncbi:MAG: carboxypeptidase regulatory-like domain-containing protein [Acidobacteria bacterium]|nr:carboxypeptidase regulatory-like domain-containing protein [Acidobacteriota bacterium]